MKTLTQKEVKDLMDALMKSTENLDTSRFVKPQPNDVVRGTRIYDFQRPERVSKQNIRDLAVIMDQLALNWKKDIESIFELYPVDVHTIAIDQCAFKDFLHSLPSPVACSVLKYKDYEIQMSLDPGLTYTFMNLLDPMSFPSDKKCNREYKDEEIATYRKKIVKPLLKALSTALGGKGNLKDNEFLHYPVNRYSQGLTEMCVLVEFEVDISNKLSDNSKISELIELCLPWRLVKEMVKDVKKTNGKNSVSTNELTDIPVQIEGILGSGSSSLKEVTGLKKGSIIELDRIAGEDVDVVVNGKKIAKAEVVVTNEKFALRITEFV